MSPVLQIPQCFWQNGAFLSLDSSKVLLSWGKKKTLLNYPCWYVPDFFLKNSDFIHFENNIIIDSGKLVESHPPKENLIWSSPDWDYYHQTFQTLSQKFLTGELKKAVPYVQIHAKNESGFHQSVFQSILSYFHKTPQVTIYGYWDEGEGIMGATPEILCHIRGNTLHTMACAGTSTSKEFNHKLKQEHQLVIEGIKEDFNTLTIGQTEIRTFGSLSHLITPLQVQGVNLKDISLIIKKLHPTPALGAYPKESGLKWLKDYNIHLPRGRFGAPFGAILDKKKANIHVAIRGIQWKEDKITLSVGGGVIQESEYELEKEELIHKLMAVRKLVNL